MTKLSPFRDDWPEDETFEEQMDALGVEIVGPEIEIKWYRDGRKGRGPTGLLDRISVNASGMTFGSKVVKMIGEKSRIKVAAVMQKSAVGEKETTFALKLDKKGFKLSKTRTGSYRINAKALSEWLFSHGIKKGRYYLKKVKGGYMAVSEAKKV